MTTQKDKFSGVFVFLPSTVITVLGAHCLNLSKEALQVFWSPMAFLTVG